MPKHGGWNTTLLADVYGGDEAEEKNARTGCHGCPLVQKDKALDLVIQLPQWEYLKPLKGLKPLYRLMRLPQYRPRKAGRQRKKDGSLAKNQQRMRPLTLEAREHFLKVIISIQNKANSQAVKLGRPKIDILNSAEVRRIKEMISEKVYPNGWDGTEPEASKPLDKMYSDGSVMKRLFY